MLEKLQNPVSDTASDFESVVTEPSKEDVGPRRKRGRPATKDKSVGTGPSQPPVNKAVQVRSSKNSFQYCQPEKQLQLKAAT